MIKVVIIDAKEQDRSKIESLLAAQDEIKILAQGKDGYDALKLISSLKPDIVTLDTNLEFIEGEEIPPLLRVRSPSTAIVIVTARISDHQLYRAASNEVSGFVDKETDMDTLPEILKCIFQGGCFISPSFAARILHLLTERETLRPLAKDRMTEALTMKRWHLNFPNSSLNQPLTPLTKESMRHIGKIKFSASEDPAGQLSKMELRILTYIGKGHTGKEIANILGLSAGTVRNYISSVMHKTGLHNRSQIACYACHYGLIP